MDSKFAIDYKQILRWLMISAAVIALLAINYCSLSEHMASNNKYITNYTLPDDYEERNRPTVVAGVFYSSATKSVSSEKKVYDIPRIMVVPEIEDIYSATIAEYAYNLLSANQTKIKNILMIAPAIDPEIKQGISLVDIKDKKTKVDSLVSENNVKVLKTNEQQLKVFKKQLEILNKKLKKFQFIPLVYKRITSQELAEAVDKYTQNINTLIIFVSDLSENEGNINNEIAEQTIIALAKQNDLLPKIIDFSSGQKEKKDTREKDMSINQDALRTLADDIKSLQDFKRVHEEEIKTIAKEALTQAVFEGKKYKPSRKDYKDSIFDKGAVYITLKKQGQKRAWSGSVLATQSLAKNISENIYVAAKEDKRFENIKPQEMQDITITISLLSGFEEIKYKNEQDLLEKLVPEKDGIVIRSGNRQAVFLPSEWKEFPDKQRFLNELKLKAGMSPIYWSNKIKVYRFYTVEID